MRVLSLTLLLLVASSIRAEDSLSGQGPLNFEVHMGQLIRPAYWNYTPYPSEAVSGYYFSSGWETGLSLSAPIGRRFAFSTRWKIGVFSSKTEQIAAAFAEEYPGMNFTARGRRWRMNQLNTGFTANFFFENSSIEIGQYAGISVLNIPYLRVLGGTEILVIREPQRQSTASLYTTLAGKYHFSPRRYVFVRAEFAFHRIKRQRIEIETVFGTSDIYRGTEDNYFINYSVSFGLGWRLGKRY